MLGVLFFAKFEACKHIKFINGTYFERSDDNLSEYYRIFFKNVETYFINIGMLIMYLYKLVILP